MLCFQDSTTKGPLSHHSGLRTHEKLPAGELAEITGTQKERERDRESERHIESIERETSALQDLLSQYELPTSEGYITIFYFLLEATAELLNFV